MGLDSKSSIIKSISSPLGFFALSLLIVEGFLGIVLVYSGMGYSSKFWGMIIGAALFVIVVAIVSLLVAYKPKNLIFGEESHLKEDSLIYGSKDKPLTEHQLEKEEPRLQDKKE